MEASRGAQRYWAVVPLLSVTLLAVATGTANADPEWDADFDGNSIEVGGEESSETGSGGGSGSGSGGALVESLSVSDCTAFLPDGTVAEACSDPFSSCPENDEPGAVLYLRVLNFQRDLDPASGEALSGWEYVGTECVPFDDAIPDGPDEGPSLLAEVIAEWRRVTIPAATITVVPPGGRTLVNFDTIVHTDAGQQVFPVTILGRDVVIYADPVTYTWVFGDGATATTTTPGVPYTPGEPVSEQAITHQYQRTGDVRLRVDVEYRGEFTVDGGPRQTIPGSADVAGIPTDVTVVQARTQLIDPDT